jgi:hypothetical protein
VRRQRERAGGVPFELTRGWSVETFVLVASEAASLIDFRGDLIRAVRARGDRVVCFAPAADESVEQTLTKWGAEVENLPLDRRGLDPLADLRYILQLWRRLRRLRPDVVMGYTPKLSIYAAIAFAKKGAKVVVAGRRDEAGKALVKELRSLGSETEFINADVRKEDDVRALVDKTVARFGPRAFQAVSSSILLGCAIDQGYSIPGRHSPS